MAQHPAVENEATVVLEERHVLRLARSPHRSESRFNRPVNRLTRSGQSQERIDAKLSFGFVVR